MYNSQIIEKQETSRIRSIYYNNSIIVTQLFGVMMPYELSERNVDACRIQDRYILSRYINLYKNVRPVPRFRNIIRMEAEDLKICRFYVIISIDTNQDKLCYCRDQLKVWTMQNYGIPENQLIVTNTTFDPVDITTKCRNQFLKEDYPKHDQEFAKYANTIYLDYDLSRIRRIEDYTEYSTMHVSSLIVD